MQDISGREKPWIPFGSIFSALEWEGGGETDLGKYEVSLEPTEELTCYKDSRGSGRLRRGAGAQGTRLRPWECGCCSSEALIWGQGWGRS